MKLKFGEPHHGWLPVKIEFEDCAYEFEASDVPVDPLERLIDALCVALAFREREVWWHLEPDGYYFNIAFANDVYSVTLSYAKGSKTKNKKHLCACKGSFPDIVLPIWRALREFYSHKYTEPHWPSEPTIEMQALTDQIKAMQNKR